MPILYQTLKTVLNSAKSLSITLPWGAQSTDFPKAVKALSPKPGISLLMGLLFPLILPSVLSFQLTLPLGQHFLW